MWTKLIFIGRILFKMKKIGPEIKEAIEAVKAVDLDGVNDRAEVEKAFMECMDVIDILVPGMKKVADVMREK